MPPAPLPISPEERLIRTLEASLRSYDAARARDDATPDPWWLAAPLADIREGIAAWRAEHPRTEP